MRVITHQTDIEGTEFIELIKRDDKILLHIASHPMEGKEPFNIFLDKESVLELIEDLQQIIQ